MQNEPQPTPPDLDAVLRLAEARRPLVWSSGRRQLVGLGDLKLIGTPGAGSADWDASAADASPAGRLAEAWRRYSTPRVQAGADPHRLIAFGWVPFSIQSEARARLIVPELAVGGEDAGGSAGSRDSTSPTDPSRPAGPAGPARPAPAGRAGENRRTLAEVEAAGSAHPLPWGPAPRTELHGTPDGRTRFERAVAAGIARIDAGDCRKVVLGREVSGHVSLGADLRHLIRRLQHVYADCCIFAVDGLIGASPERLATVSGGQVRSRVLAGTAARGADPASDRRAGRELERSEKDRAEHAFARDSVQSALAGLCTDIALQRDTELLRLPNVWHLSSELTGRLRPGAGVLDAVAALHPTAAVAGTPAASALHLIAALEDADRGRFAGAVGWIDAAGDGEWALAIRCAEFAPAGEVRAWAGCGIVAGSDPAREWDETELKLRPMRDALSAAERDDEDSGAGLPQPGLEP
ncbi:MAG: chorismate-binding protein [Pseudoclavibacter sp.]